MMEAGGGESWEEQKLLSPMHLGSNPSWLSAQQKYVQMSFERKFTAALFIMTLTWKRPKYPSNSRMDTASVHSYNGLLYSRVNSRPLHGTNMDYSYTVEPMKPDTKEYIQHDSMCRQLVEFIYGTDL